MSKEVHELEIQQEFFDDGYCAECSCGWHLDDFETMAEAREAWENHCDDVFIKSTEGGEKE